MHGGASSDYRVALDGIKRSIAVVGWVSLALMVAATVTAWLLLAIR